MPKLIFSFPEIPEEGLLVKERATTDELGLLPDEARAADPLSINARVTKSGNRIYVDGDVTGTFERECVRCLKEYTVFTRVPFSVVYKLGDLKAQGLGMSASDDDHENDEVYACTEEGADLTEMLREQIILSTPMQPLCHDECRGLCPVCQRNWNQAECGCQEWVPPNPFAKLQGRLGIHSRR
jgi:uncharacterized protein